MSLPPELTAITAMREWQNGTVLRSSSIHNSIGWMPPPAGAKMLLHTADRASYAAASVDGPKAHGWRALPRPQAEGHTMRWALPVIFLGGSMLLQWVPVLAARV